MDDLHLKSRLDAALERQLEPMRPEVASILLTSRRAHRRRTSALCVLTVGAVSAVLLGTSWLATSGLSRLDGDSTQMASDPSPSSAVATEKVPLSDVDLPRTDTAISRACSQATHSSVAANTLLFKSGGARLVARVSSRSHVWALFESRVGTLWGRCELREGHIEMAVFRTGTDLDPPDHYVRTSEVCGGGACVTEARLLVRLPPQIRAVRVSFADSYQVLRPARDGWVALAHVLDGDSEQPPIRRLTYFGAGGRALAEYSETSLDGVNARDLPPLTTYPALSEADPLYYDDGAYFD